MNTQTQGAKPVQAGHTPGPLSIRVDFLSGASKAPAYSIEKISDGLRSVLCRTHPDLLCPEHGGTCAGNVSLFAAAPDLLSALDHLETASDDANWAEAVALIPELEAVLEQARAAIRKARQP